MVWDRTGTRIAYNSTRRNGKDVDLYTMDPASPASDRLLATVEGGGWFPVDWSPDGKQIAVVEFLSINESKIWRFDAATGQKRCRRPRPRASRWPTGTCASAATAMASTSPPIGTSSSCGGPGRSPASSISRRLASPASGRSSSTSTTGRRASRNRASPGRDNYLLNELGIAVLFPNIRGCAGYCKNFLKLDNGYRREDSYKDIDALLDWIKTQPHLDGQRILVTGGSYGGHMALAVATNYSDKICYSIPVVGMSNLVTFLRTPKATGATCGGWNTATSATRRCASSCGASRR